MSDRVTSDGVSRDLEAVADAGLEHVQHVAISDRTPPSLLVSYSPERLDPKASALPPGHRLAPGLPSHHGSSWSSGSQRPKRSETFVSRGQVGDLNLPRPWANGDHYQGTTAPVFPFLPGDALPPPQPLQSVTANAQDVGIPRSRTRPLPCRSPCVPRTTTKPATCCLTSAIRTPRAPPPSVASNTATAPPLEASPSNFTAVPH